MPLMYVPLIMYASWMDFMTRGFVEPQDRTVHSADKEQRAGDARTRA